MLGAIVASARLHRSPEITGRQELLRSKIRLFNRLATEAGFPVLAESEAPIRCVGAGVTSVAYRLTARMRDAGFFVEHGRLPRGPGQAVRRPAGPDRCTTPTTTWPTWSRPWPGTCRSPSPTRAPRSTTCAAPSPGSCAAATRSGGTAWRRRPCRPSPCRGRRRRDCASSRRRRSPPSTRSSGTRCSATGAPSTSRGCASWRRSSPGTASRAVTRTRWDFTYLVVRDDDGTPVAATFFTTALWKDDMLSPAHVSREVERRGRARTGTAS